MSGRGYNYSYSYSAGVLVGNWNEDVCLEEVPEPAPGRAGRAAGCCRGRGPARAQLH